MSSQDIEVLYAVAVAGQITATALIGAFVGAVRRLSTPGANDGETAWETFRDFVQRTFQLVDLKLVDVSADGDGWVLAAEARGRRYQGRVSGDGRILEARRS